MEVSTPAGTTTSVTLGDGTQVLLSANSRLTYDKDFTLFTMQLGNYDSDLQDFLEDHGVHYYNPYVPGMSPVLEFMLNYVLPTIVMVGIFVLFMNLMAKRGGGMGGSPVMRV